MPIEWSKFDERGLARHVIPELPTSFQLPSQVNRLELIHWVDYRQLLEEIYNALKVKNIKYALEPFNSESNTQLIRTPQEILGNYNEGTCLDLAVLFCGICLACDLLPLLIILEGHALAAVSMLHQRKEWKNSTDEEREKARKLFQDKPLDNHEQLQELISSGDFLPIECTGFVSSFSTLSENMPEGIGRTEQGFLSFERAIEAGKEQLNRSGRKLKFSLDIAITHEYWKIKPLTIQYSETKNIKSPSIYKALPKLFRVLNRDELSRQKNLFRSILIIGFICFILSTAFNILSYDFLSSDYSRPWREWHPIRYIGSIEINAVWGDIIIEIIRNILLTIGAVFLIGKVFIYETFLFLRLRQPSVNEIKLLNCFYVIGTFLLILAVLGIGIYHFDFAPNELMKKYPQYINMNDFKQYYYPYRYYVLYSFINIIIIGIPTFLITLYAALNNIYKIYKIKKFFSIVLNSIRSNEQDLDKCESVKNKFQELNSNLLEMFNHYSIPVLFMTLVITFEYTLAKITLSNSGEIWTWICYGLILLILLIISIIYFLYGNFTIKTRNYLVQVRCKDNDIYNFKHHNNTTQFIKDILNNSYGYRLAFINLFIIFIFEIINSSNMVDILLKN
ncbi:hypothetical protein I4641_17335 [Waterburya agarophytonicola K14]|uniref:Uncharacterized protein n=1 Tax=Waterburya agarophytonicola KI4 TaxID=2874699 RepID=A0A964FH58_9CYAN|nr:hypothetical protein [Waterburya agarophytonicola]MCC0178737.1 hypothetical protein [Waterburya agarophytonicola KI4]